MRRALALMLALVLTAALGRPAAAVDPRLHWRTLVTPHFRIHFPDGGYPVALKAGRDLEAAYARLTALLVHHPWRPVEVVLTDDVDTANGSATTIPIPQIHGYMHPPGSESILDDYDDWEWLLLVHELTHVMHLGTVGGIPALGNTVFGHLFGPNFLQPDWIIEGLAVYYESLLSSGGRNRSSLASMFLRAQVLDHGRLWPVDEAGGDPVDWPNGNVWYLYGGRLWRWMVAHRGDAAPSRISHDYGARLFPYAVNLSSERAVGLPWRDAYRRWAKETADADRARIAAVRRAGERRGRMLTHLGRSTGVPRWLPDGAGLVVYADGGKAFPALRRLTLPRTRPARLPDLKVIHRIPGAGIYDLDRVGRVLVYSRGEFFQQQQIYADLFAVGLEGGPAVQLTRGMRARDPALSPDGTRLAFVAGRRGETAVYVMAVDLRDAGPGRAPVVRLGTPVRVFHRTDVQADRPAFSPDGKALALSLHRHDGGRDIALLDLSKVAVPPPDLEVVGRRALALNGAPAPRRPARPDEPGPGPGGVRGSLTWVTRTRAMDLDPVFDPKGRWLYFTSDRTGIYDVYAQPLKAGRPDGALLQVTNTPTGAFEARPSPDGSELAYTDYSSRGYDVALLPVSPSTWTPAPPWHDDLPPPGQPRSAKVWPVRPYDPWHTLRPFYWQPFLTADPDGLALGVSTSGSDIVGYDAWTAAAWYGIASRRPGYYLSYTYAGAYPTLSVSSGLSYQTGGTAEVNGVSSRYTEMAWSGSAQATFYLPHLDRSQTLSLGFTVDNRSPAEALPTSAPGSPAPILPERGTVTRLDVGWSGSTVQQFAESLGPQEGLRLGLHARVASRVLGGSFDFVEVFASAQAYTPIPGLTGHVLALNLEAGAGVGDFGGRRFFAVGGLSLDDPVLSILQGTGFGGPTVRGFPPYAFTGDGYGVANLEWRFPLSDPQRGLGTLPIFLRRIYGAAFVDAGTAGDPPFQLTPTGIHVGVGAELRAEIYLSYALRFTLRLGWAHGLGKGGVSQPYLGFGGIF